jgi:hypothetical protein
VWSHNAGEKGRLAFTKPEVTRHGYHLTSMFHLDHLNVYLLSWSKRAAFGRSATSIVTGASQGWSLTPAVS